LREYVQYYFHVVYYKMEIDRLPNIIDLKMEHLIDPSPPGEKVIPLDFRNLDYSDPSGRAITFRACKGMSDFTSWYRERLVGYPNELAPFLAYQTMFPHSKIPQNKGSFSKQIGNYILSFA
jgi:hypothetical protein